MLTSKNPQKSAAKAHMNDLLDEALKGTFPASDPIAIHVELESRETRRQGTVDAVEGDEARGP